MRALDVPEGSCAVVTGASSGIGEAIARKLCERHIPTLLVARSADRLERLAASWRAGGGVVDVLPLDLSEPGAAEALHAKTEGAGRPVDLLVNSAGFGLNGSAVELPLERTLAMLRLNVVTVTELSVRFLRSMRARGRGRILNVASTAGFLPTPYFAAYGATKAFVLALTQALHVEARRYGVTVTCLCPGYTRTEFQRVAGMRGPGGTPFPEMLPDAVAEAGLSALARGKAFHVTHPLDRLWIAALRLVPRSVPAGAASLLFERSQVKG